MSKLGCRFFIDMDGVLAVFNNNIKSEEELYKKGYFKNLSPQNNILDAVKWLADENEVYILSCYLKESKYALDEKISWLKEYIPEIPENHYLFVPCGNKKTDYVPWGVGPYDILVDDYGENIKAWKEANNEAYYVRICEDQKDVKKKENSTEDKRAYFACENMDTDSIYSQFFTAAKFANKEHGYEK